MLSFLSKAFWTASTCVSLVSAQTYTSCNPLQRTCPSNPGLLSKSLSTDFTTGGSSDWAVLNGSSIGYTSNGVGFTINSKNDNPTLGTSFYMLFGYVEVRMKAAPGTGIVSAIVLQSDDLDEIDWEILGGVPNSVQTNFFGKGDTSSYTRGQTHAVSASTTTFHTYGIEWTSDAITWSIDGNVVRKLLSTDASTSGGKNFPQSPCQVRIGNWPAGASVNSGTVSWAGGPTDFSKAPFTMYVSNVNIINYNPATSYTYGDNSGSWQSIKMAGTSSSVNGGNVKSGPVAGGSNTTNSASASASAIISSNSSRTTLSAASMNSTTTKASSITGGTSTSTPASSNTASPTATRTNDAMRGLRYGTVFSAIALIITASLLMSLT